MCREFDFGYILYDPRPEGPGIQWPLVPLVTIVVDPCLTPRFTNLLFSRCAYAKEYRIFVRLRIVCSDGASVELPLCSHIDYSPT